MARVANWRAKEVFNEVKAIALAQAEEVMDDVVLEARARCPISPIFREGKWATNQTVSILRKKGKLKGTVITFNAKRWLGRLPGDLRDTIRKVTKHDRLGNIRVYAGNTKIYWAFMVERGTVKTPAQPFLRPAFHNAQVNAIARIQARL
jgi:HK97 gp10 family phage protein